jgi:spermidine/putrescine transport system ATP-binding protein
MSDRIAVMNNGRYEQLGDPESLYERPTTRFVAGFLGVSNLIRGQIDGSADAYVMVKLDADTRIRVPRAMTNGHADVEVGVRPEKIRLHKLDATVPDGSNELVGTVLDASYIGVSTQYIVETANGDEVTVFAQNVGRSADHVSRGDQVRVLWDPEHTFVITDTREVPTLEEQL